MWIETERHSSVRVLRQDCERFGESGAYVKRNVCIWKRDVCIWKRDVCMWKKTPMRAIKKTPMRVNKKTSVHEKKETET